MCYPHGSVMILTPSIDPFSNIHMLKFFWSLIVLQDMQVSNRISQFIHCKNQNIYSSKSIVDDGLQCASAHHLTSKEGIAVGLECTGAL